MPDELFVFTNYCSSYCCWLRFLGLL